MKKILSLLAAVVCAAGLMAECQDGPYALYVNGASVYTFEDAGMSPDQLPQLHAVAALKQGDKVEFCNTSCDAKWFPQNIETGGDVDGSGNFTITSGVSAICNVAGCYNFWWKKQANDDKVYIGTDGDCSGGSQGGGDNPGGQGGGDPVEDEDVNYYAIGWINGADHGESAYDVYEDEYLFVDGKLMIDCRMGSYICIKDHLGNFYRSKTPTTIQDTQVTLDWQNGWAGGEKWAIPEGVNYIIIRSAACKGQIKLERVDKATFDAYHYGSKQGVENVQGDKGKSYKMIIDGQLRIIRGDKMFDATGKEVK
ncbi:MAG: hypothetical protein IKP57_05280 [Paludibacteraceae bacterium]|nr:hypothetical protein [Paludibacteraceae bacterium]